MAVDINKVKEQIAKMKAEKEMKANMPVQQINIEQIVREANNIFIAPSEAQIKTYIKICRDKGQDIDMGYRKWDGRKNGQMDKEIKRLLQLPNVKRPSEAQIEALKEICARNDWEVPEHHNLTGGREGTMSKLISELLQLEQQVRREAPPTEAQIETILEMYYCPNINLADLHQCFEIQYTVIDGKTFWTRTNQEEMLVKLPELITYQEASDFIYKYHLDFYKWKTTRLSEGQMRRIQYIQEKCGMKPMEDYQLMCMDKEQADRYIKSQEYIWRDRELVKFRYEPLQDTERGANTVEKAIDKDREAKETLIHSLYASMGMLAKDDSDECIDVSEQEDIIRDLSQLVAEIIGIESVLELLLTAYTEEEACDILNISLQTEQEIPF